jgi:hypothetical protein
MRIVTTFGSSSSGSAGSSLHPLANAAVTTIVIMIADRRKNIELNIASSSGKRD